MQKKISRHIVVRTQGPVFVCLIYRFEFFETESLWQLKANKSIEIVKPKIYFYNNLFDVTRLKNILCSK